MYVALERNLVNSKTQIYSYSGNSSPTQGNKTYRNNGTHRERNQNNSIRKTNYLSEPSDRFLTRAHLVELNTPPDSLCNGSKWDQLSQSIWQKFSSRQQTEDTYRKKTYLWKYLNSNIKKGFNRYSLYLVGSTISGFGLDSSDVDMCLVSRCVTPLDPRSEAMMHLSLLKNHLQNTSGEYFNLKDQLNEKKKYVLFLMKNMFSCSHFRSIQFNSGQSTNFTL